MILTSDERKKFKEYCINQALENEEFATQLEKIKKPVKAKTYKIKAAAYAIVVKDFNLIDEYLMQVYKEK